MKVGGLFVDKERVRHPDELNVLCAHHQLLEASPPLELQAGVAPELAEVHVQGEVLQVGSVDREQGGGGGGRGGGCVCGGCGRGKGVARLAPGVEKEEEEKKKRIRSLVKKTLFWPNWYHIRVVRVDFATCSGRTRRDF